MANTTGRRVTIPRYLLHALALGILVFGSISDGAVAQSGYEPYESPIPDEPTFGRGNSSGDKGSFGGLKPGLGREDTYYAFSGCFKVGWIKRQNLRRTEWDMAVDKLVLDCNLLPLGDEEKTIIVNYLVANYGRGR